MTRAVRIPGEVGRLLGGVKLAALRAVKAEGDLERQVVRAAGQGCSLREIAAAAGFGSHHKVQQILARAGAPAVANGNDAEAED